MMFFAIMMVAENNRVGQYMEFDSQVEAEAHIAAHAVDFPNAFVFEADARVDDILIVDGVPTIQPDQAAADAEHNAEILRQIYKLEQDSLRAVRELALDPSANSSRSILQQREADIVALRGQLR